MNTLREKIGKGEEGSAIFIVLVVIMALSITAGKLFETAIWQVSSVEREADEMRAKAIAEAGASEAFALLAADFSKAFDAGQFPETAFNGGTYDVAVTALHSNKVVIVSVGRCGAAVEEVALDVKYVKVMQPTGQPEPVGAYACAIFSNGAMTWTGTKPVEVKGGKIHTNSRYRMVGGVTVIGAVQSCLGIGSTGTTGIEGDAAAPAYDGKSPANITGVVYTGPVATLPIPDIDLTPYYNHALANGEVYSGSQHFTGSGVLMPRGGVMWVNGDLQISGTKAMVGCFIATGSIKISTAGSHMKVGNCPAFVSRDGSIDISGTGDIHGLVYAKTGNFEISGGGRVVGSIIAAGTFTKTGSFAIMAYENSTPVPPGDPGVLAGSDMVCVWQK